jgi:DNA-binding winged helix-turn-helix (wHTH) protein
MRIRFGQFELDEQRFLLQRDGVRLQVRPKVFDLLAHLVRHHERVVLRDELVMALWGTTAIGLGSLSGLVNELRQVLGEAGRGPSSIRTVHARGYQFVAKIDLRNLGEAPPTRANQDTTGDGSRGGTIATRPGPFGMARGLIRSSFARVSTVGPRAVIVVGLPGSGRSSLLDHASAELAHAGFEIHRLLVVARNERHPSTLVDRLIDALVERYGIDAIRSAIPARSRELTERLDGMRRPVSGAGPRDPLASRQYDERVWRSAAELLRELAQQRPLALVLDDRGQNRTAATLAVALLLRLLGKARVFILCTASASGASDSGLPEEPESGIEYVRLPPMNRRRLNELLESRGIAALPVALADALAAHVREDEASFESVAGWLQAEANRDGPVSGGQALPNIDRRMKRVEPDTPSRRPRFGNS